MSAPLPPPGSGSGTSTQEIPVVPAAVANTQHLPPPPSAPAGEVPEAMRTTGPVEFVPQPPAVQARPTATGRAGLAAVALAFLAVVVLELGLALAFGSRSFWSAIPLWSAFATLVAAGGLATVAGPALMRRSAGRRDATVLTACAAGLGVFWLLVVLPVADTDRGFLLTAALGLLGAAAWLCPRPAR